ncbi:T3SS effector HopA1 family protein [Roseivirga sp. BDSF3-8]|uniref:T3SS effector HopA1 family protein n=1 Tax=Roseivirga sp. BDSF3-8 TaxID=3241598 RepID=UPI0035325309
MSEYIKEHIQKIAQSLRLENDVLLIPYGKDGKYLPPYSPEDDEKKALQQLANALYFAYYCKNTHLGHTDSYGHMQADLLEELRAANTGKPGVSHNWFVTQSLGENNGVFAERRNQSNFFYSHEIAGTSGNQKPSYAFNECINVYNQTEYFDDKSIFYHVFSETPYLKYPVGAVRFYFNIVPEGMPRLVHALSSVFNSHAVPFHFKCIRQRHDFGRCDTAVLYVASQHAQVVSYIIESLRPGLDPFVRDLSPMFTHRLSRGISFAENPDTNESFGMTRMHILAQALYEQVTAKAGFSGLYDCFLDHLNSGGYSPSHIYRNPRSGFHYSFL